MKRFLPIILGLVFLIGALGSCDRIQSDVVPNPIVDISGELLSNRVFYSDPKSTIAFDLKDFLKETKANSLTVVRNGELGKTLILSPQSLLLYQADSSVNVADDYFVLKTTNTESSKSRLDTFKIKINTDISALPCNAGAMPDFFEINNIGTSSQSFVLDVLKNDRYCNAILDSTSLQVVFKSVRGSLDVKNNRIVYTPPVGYDGTDFFLYKICTAGAKPVCRIVGVRLEVEGTGKKTCVTTLLTDIWGMNATDTTAQYIDVLKNDKLCDNIDRTSLKVSIKPKYGTIKVNSSNVIEYKLIPTLLPSNQKINEDVFAYTVTNKEGATSPNVPVTIRLKESSCQPDVNNGVMEVKESTLLGGASVSIPYYLNMTECTRVGSLSVTRQGQYGTVSVVNGQQLVYKLNNDLKDKGKNREDNFIYQLKTLEGKIFSVNFKIRITS